MILANSIDISMADAGVTALLGYAVVFFGLILLMIVVILFGKAFMAAEKKQTAPAEPVASASVSAPETAPGSAGGVKLYNVEPRTAAMIMASVADKLQKPLNELRFVSIKEVEE